jgi:hypothetical protein
LIWPYPNLMNRTGIPDKTMGIPALYKANISDAASFRS